MKIITPELTIGESETFEQDVLGRHHFGESLLNLVSKSNQGLVISLDGKWGEGKTTFVRMWQGMLNNANIPNIYIDAFANDYIDDAFIAIAGSITSFLEEKSDDNTKTKAREFKQKAKHVGAQLLSWSAKVGIKALTLGAIKNTDIKELQEISTDVATGLSSVVSNLVEEKLESYKQDIETIESFKLLLSELPSLLSERANSPLVIIIDELDRCRPNYAVELIEKIKHLFLVDNVVFILVMNKKQLENAIKCIYGSNIDAQSYLQKFIHIETHLPINNNSIRDTDLHKYNRKLFSQHEIETWGDNNDGLIETIDELAIFFKLSLRQLEKVYTNIALFYASSSERQLRVIPLVAFLSTIKVIQPETYLHLTNKNLTYSKVSDLTGITENNQSLRRIAYIANWLRFSLYTDEEFEQLDDDDRIRSFVNTLWHYNLSSRQDLIPIFTRRINYFQINK